MAKKRVKVCLISSSGGHFEQLQMLRGLKEKYDVYVVTEKTKYPQNCDYTLFAGSNRRIVSAFHLFLNLFASLGHIIKEKPDVIITTGTMVAFPTLLWAKLLRKKIIYIETFARVRGGTNAGTFVYKHHLYSTFIYQWETQKEYYPDGIYGGGIY